MYAEDVQLNVNNGTIATGSVIGTIQGKVDGKDITEGTISGGSLTGGTFNGTVTLTGDNIKTAIEGVDISQAKVGSDTNSLTIGGLAANTQKIIYNASTGTTVDGVVLKDKGITAADGKFKVDGTNAETVVSGDNGKTTIYGGGITVDSADNNSHVLISDGGVVASGSVTSTIIADVGGARMEKGNVVAKNSLYIGATNIVDPTQDNSKFYVSGESGNVVSRGIVYAKGLNVAAGKFAVDSKNGSFKAANGAFNVSDGGAITADSLTLADSYDVKQNIEDAKSKITTVEGELNTNKANLTALQGRVDDHDTEIGALKTKTQGITRVEGNSTTVEGVNFKDGAVSGVKSINGDIEFDKDGTKVWVNGAVAAGGVAANNITANKFVTVGNITDGYVHMTNAGIAVSGRLYSSLDPNATDLKSVSVAEMANTRDNTNKISYNDTEGTKIDSNVIINKGKKNQVAITEDGIVVGLNSSVVNDDGVFAGGHGYDNAKAAFNANDGSIKGANGKFAVDENGAVSAADGAFGVDKDGNATVGGTLNVTGNIQGKDITATGALKGQTLGIGTNGSEFTVDENGNAAVGGTLGVNGATTLGSTLDVTGKTTLKDALEVKGKATFGNAPGAMTEIDGDKFTTGVITTAKAQESNIGGVKMSNGKITADNMTIAGTLDMENLKVKNELTVGTFGVTQAGVVTGVTSINDVAVSKQGTGLTIGSATVGDSNPFSSQGYTVDATSNVSAKDITAGKYNGNEITADKKFNGVELDGGNVKATKVTAATITDDNGFTATGGNVTAKNIQADTGTIAGVNFAAGGSVSGISELTATTIKDGAGTIITGGNVESKTAKIGAINIDNETIEGSSAHGLSIEGVKIKDGVMSAVVSIDATKATIGGVNTLDNTGLTVKTGSKVQVGTNTVIEDGSVKVSPKTSLTDQSLQLNDTNKWTQTGGLVADKATVNGIALGTDSKGKATFSDAAGNTTTIDGDKITTGTITADKLLIDKISLGKDGNDNISIDKDGDVTTKGEIRITDAAGNVMTKLAEDSATFGKDAANQTTIDKGKISAKAKSTTNQIAEFGFDENGLTVSGQNAAGQKSSFSFNAKTGANTFTGQDGTTTTINGSAITSTKATGDTGVLDGSNLTLKKGVNSTVMTAGGVTFTGKQGASTQHGDTTTIDGGIITTDTLKVQCIQLGEKIVDERTGKEIGSGVTLAADGGFTAAGGNFKVVGGTTGSRGSITNIVGDDNSGKTVFETNQQGANMSFEKGGVTSNVSVGESKANVSAGNASIDVVNGSITDKVGGTTVKTKDGSFSVEGNTGNGMKINTNTGETTFTGAAGEKGGNTTTINGGNITTDTLNVERINLGGEMVDKNGTSFGSNLSMDAKGNFSAAGGKFKVNGADGAMTNTVGKTSFATSDDGVNSSVTQDDTHKSEFKQGLTSIGGVVTNGEIKVAQKLDGATGLLTNEVTDANGSSKLVQNGTGLTYTDSAKPDNATRINSSDVSIGSATDDSKRINLSDLGQIDELDKELTDRDEYKNNPTAVGGINAEAAIRREEVARLDGRINDVNDRVNKVGAMAAAIASLKSIGYDPQAPSEFSIGLGQYKGETGVAMGFFHYPNKNFMINVSLSTAGGETMGGIGATWRFGHKSPQKLLEEQREAQAKKELAAAEKYQAAAKLAKEAQERAEYAAKLARQAQVSADNAKAAADATQAKHFG